MIKFKAIIKEIKEIILETIFAIYEILDTLLDVLAELIKKFFQILTLFEELFIKIISLIGWLAIFIYLLSNQ